MSYFDLDRTEIGCSLEGDLIVVVPIYNEMVNIRLVVTEWRTALTNLGIKFQLLLINDGLTDGTLAELQASEKESPDCICLIHKLNTGHGPTIRLGYEIACASPAEWVLQIDSDGQCDPRFFSNLWQRRQDCECVIAVRRSRNDGTARIITSWICRTGSSLITGVNLQDPNVPYRLMKREVLSAAIKRIPRNFNIHNVALTYVLRKNPAVRFSYVLVHFLDRQGGSNSINVLRVSQWGFDMLLELAQIKV